MFEEDALNTPTVSLVNFTKYNDLYKIYLSLSIMLIIRRDAHKYNLSGNKCFC